MSDFLLEIYGEEIPSSSQLLVKDQLKYLFSKILNDEDIKCESLSALTTSRRVVLIAKKLKRKESKKNIEIRGPSVTANKKAIDGFLRSNNVSDKKKLKKRIINNKEYFVLIKNFLPKKINHILGSSLPKILNSIKWKKSMRWSTHSDRWIRPILNILCIYNKKIVKFNFANLKSNNITYGNYHYSSKKLKCSTFSEYQKILRKNYVLLDDNIRKEKILSELKKFSKKNNFQEKFDLPLLKRTSDSVEWPNVFFGSFEVEFFKLPYFLIETIIKEKQDNFCFYNLNGELSNYFAFVSNKDLVKKNKLIEGNQNVLRARFEDARFFIDEDLKVSLDQKIKKLSSIIFYDNLGSLKDRAFRIVDLCEVISIKLNFKINSFKSELIYSNFDLTTDIVKEYPSLQGLAGGFYSKIFKFNESVSEAFSNQYKSIFTKVNTLSIILSVAQKVDSIFGFFSSQKKISGSGDPFGIRRLVLSLIRLMIENDINLDFFEILEQLQKIYQKQKLKGSCNIQNIKDYFNIRMKNFLLEKRFDNSVINLILNKNNFDPKLTYDSINSLTNFLMSNEGVLFLKAFKRLDSIIEEPKEKKIVNENLLNEIHEKRLFKIILDIENKTDFNILKIDKVFFKKIADTINSFLDKIIVNVEDKEVRTNRKILLQECKRLLNSIINFSSLGT